MPFILFFSCLFALSGTSVTMVGSSDECSHPCLVPNVKGESTQSVTFKMLAIVVTQMPISGLGSSLVLLVC